MKDTGHSSQRRAAISVSRSPGPLSRQQSVRLAIASSPDRISPGGSEAPERHTVRNVAPKRLDRRKLLVRIGLSRADGLLALFGLPRNAAATSSSACCTICQAPTHRAVAVQAHGAGTALPAWTAGLLPVASVIRRAALAMAAAMVSSAHRPIWSAAPAGNVHWNRSNRGYLTQHGSAAGRFAQLGG